VLGENMIFYSTLFDLATYSFDFPTVLSTAGNFPKPQRIADLIYEAGVQVQQIVLYL
jgi:hypothetical protein